MSADVSMSGDSDHANPNDIPSVDSSGHAGSGTGISPLEGLRQEAEGMSKQLSAQGVAVAGTHNDMQWVRQSVGAQKDTNDNLRDDVARLELVIRDEARKIDSTMSKGFEKLQEMIDARSAQEIANKKELNEELTVFFNSIYAKFPSPEDPPFGAGAGGPVGGVVGGGGDIEM